MLLNNVELGHYPELLLLYNWSVTTIGARVRHGPQEVYDVDTALIISPKAEPVRIDLEPIHYVNIVGPLRRKLRLKDGCVTIMLPADCICVPVYHDETLFLVVLPWNGPWDMSMPQ